MKQFILCLTISAFGLFLSSPTPGFADTTPVRFSTSSPMADGQWVKIGVDKTGVYEITHETLLAMGFPDPEKVGVFGRGGVQYDLNFKSSTGEDIYSDQLEPVAVLHHNGKLYFYGRGTRQFSLFRGGSNRLAEGYFSRTGRNIYTDTGYYFLTDSLDPLMMEMAGRPEITGDLPRLDHAFGMVSHEEDLSHNNTDTGQIFYGEDIGRNGVDRLEWTPNLTGALPGETATMECALYFDTEGEGTWNYGDALDPASPDLDILRVNTSTLRTLRPLNRDFTLSGDNPTIFVEVNTELEEIPVSNLDYWTLTYRRSIPTLHDNSGKRLNQETVGFPQLAPGESAMLTLAGGSEAIVLDVTNPSAPVVLPVTISGPDGSAVVTTQELPPVVTVFDPMRPQLQIKGFATGNSRVDNQDLHASAAGGADLVIICTPGLRDVADKIARLHEEYEGCKSLIATSEECYNEFSSGLPDIMAYRALVKAVYSSGHPCRNVLLLGPLYGDFRGVNTPRDPSAGLIAYQCQVISQERGAANANDIIGIMGDCINLADIHVNPMEVGVGILPIRYPDEGGYVLEKIERYLKGEDNELYLNAFLNIGGFGDRHTHETQAIQLSNLIDRLTDYSTVNSLIPCDAYGDAGSRNKLFADLHEGRVMMNYFGHGAPYKLNQKGDFFTSADVYRLRNTRLPFISFAGCSLSITDKGYRGLGESLVLSTPYGAIGTMVATRETWSGENAVYFDTFFSGLFRDGTTLTAPRHEHPLTIGEVFALAKTRISSNNELAYQLICDPALTLPVPTRLIKFDTATPDLNVGERFQVSGYVAKADGSGEADSGFNGKVALKLMQPVETLVSQDLCTGPSEDILRFPVADSQLSMAVGEVSGGRFSVDLFVPADAASFIGRPVRIHASAWSPEQRTGGGGLLTGTIRAGQHDLTSNDNHAPVIEHLYFDSELMELHVRVSDDIAPSTSFSPLQPPFLLILDGHEYTPAINAECVPFEDGHGYEKTVPIPDLSWGGHQVLVTVRDAAGNQASARTSFTYHPGGSDLTMSFSSPAVTESVFVRPECPMPENVEFVVLDDTGAEVARLPFPEDGLDWNGTDNAGRRLKPGLYKVYLIQRAGSQRKSHSDLIPLAVIGQ